MVDFQSRDTRRTYGEDSDDGENGDGIEAAETESDADDPGEIPIPEETAYAVLTVATGRIDPADPADAVVAALEEGVIATRATVDPSHDAVQEVVGDLVDRSDVAAVLTLGGVGVGPEDVTPEAVEPLFDKHLPGFGELYRALSHEREGTAIMRSRVTAGLVGTVPVFCLPDDPDAARRAVARLVGPETPDLAEAALGPDIE